MGIDLEFCQSNIQGIIKFEELSERIKILLIRLGLLKKGEAVCIRIENTISLFGKHKARVVRLRKK